MSVVVTLTPWECRIARAVGRERQNAALAAGYVGRNGQSAARALADHILGAHGELAGAAWRDRYWTGSPGTLDKKTGDVGGYQFKTGPKRDSHMIVRPDDDDRDVFVCVVGPVPVMTIVGWLYGAHAKRLAPYGDPFGTGRPAHWVPQAALRPLRTLPPPVRRPLGRAVG